MATLTISLSGSSIPGLTGNPSVSFTFTDAELEAVAASGVKVYDFVAAQPQATAILQAVEAILAATKLGKS